MSEIHTVKVTKLAQRKLRENVVDKDTLKLVEEVNSQTQRNNGWIVTSCSVDRQESSDPEFEWEYVHTLSVDHSHPTRTPEVTELDNILRKIAAKAPQPQFGRWMLSSVDDEAYNPHVSVEGSEDDEEFGYTAVSMPEDIDSYFAHLYGLDSQIARVRLALNLAIDTQWRERKHCVLYGPPGCGKSDVSLSLKDALGDEAVWSIDATAMTGAGVIKELTEREVLPRVLVVEEIEKANEEALRFFLGLLDQRGEVRKVTARGNLQRETKMFAIVTVNDMDKFRTLLAGALSSRCKNEIAFDRPSRDVMRKVLERDVKRMNGDLAWIEPALDFCEEMGFEDVREVQTHCLCGRELLLTGEYQEMVRATTPKREQEQAA